MPTILVVDDMAVFREPIAASLRSHGFDVRTAAGAREALSILRSAAVNLMLLDVSMPEVGGIDLLEVLRSESSMPRCPVILLTALADRDCVVRAASLGVRDYLLKSQFSLDELVMRINRLLHAGDGSDRIQCHEASVGAAAPRSEKATGDERDRKDDLNRRGPAPPEASEANDSNSEPADAGNEQLKSLKPMVNRQEIMDRLESCGEMKAMSPVVAELMKLTGTASSSAEQIVKVIKRDQAIALKMLKLANSVVYTRGDPVDSLDQAVIRIGVGSIRQAVMNMAVVDHFGADCQLSGVDPLQFWEHSIACGLIASDIAHRRADGEPELAFTMGLLHDVGRLVYVQQFGDLYEEVFKTAQQLQLPLERIETRLLLMNHADGMDRILHLWRFPKNLIDPIVFHHLSIGNMRRMASRRVEEVATLGLANRLAHAMLMGNSANEVIYPTEGLCQHLRTSADLIHRIEETTREQTDEIKLAMLTHSDQSAWVSRRENWFKRLKAAFRPVFVSLIPEFDSYRIFCGQLEERSDEPKNVSIVHIADQREVSSLSTKLSLAESEAGVKGLPLILLSPRGDVRLSEAVMKGRDCHFLPTPVTVQRFVATINMAIAGADALAA